MVEREFEWRRTFRARRSSGTPLRKGKTVVSREVGRCRFEQAISTADQADLYVGKERAAQRVGEVEHLGI